MKIAVVGAGVSGLSSAYYLDKAGHDVHLFEANHYVGGHTDTHSVEVHGKTWQVDTGFIVFNYANYPLFSRFLEELDVKSQSSDMSFGVHNTSSGLEYNATNLDALFCQRKNILKPSFYRMLKDLVRFYREAPKLLDDNADKLENVSSEETLGQYLRRNKYGKVFIEDHIIPMACALWSGPSVSIDDFPARYFIQFMNNHKMLSLSGRPEWRVVSGGSKSYVEAMLKAFNGQLYVATPVREIKRNTDGVELRVNGEWERFDQGVIAAHSDQALAMLKDPTDDEIRILSGIQYQNNEMHLHCDNAVMPKNRKAWASWSVRVGHELESSCTVSYYMNLLQSLDAPVDFFTSLNCGHLIDSDKVFATRQYAHPVYNASTLASQQSWSDISGVNRTHYCGAYWGWGFHEDGMRSARRCIDQILKTPENLNDQAAYVA